MQSHVKRTGAVIPLYTNAQVFFNNSLLVNDFVRGCKT